jgi:glyoxylase-like metal-dependent hydrolase (beta-lactamase superfamily II)
MSRPPLVELAAGVFAVPTSTVEGWCGLLVGDRRTLVFDTGKNAAEGATVARAAEGLGRPADLLAYSHGHWDHAGGGGAFATAEVVAHRDALAMVVEQLAKNEGPPGAGVPTVTVSGEAAFELGGLTARLLPTPGHAPGAMSLQVEGAGVLFGGDTVVTAIPPAFTDGDSVALEATLRSLARIELDVLVPGHGAIVRGAAAIREALTWPADYLGRVRDHVGRLAGSHTDDEVLALTEYSVFVGDRLAARRYKMATRHQRTVSQMLLELRAGVPA